MPPKPKADADMKTIRSFFDKGKSGGNAGKSQSQSKNFETFNGNSPTKPIELVDSDDEPIKPTPPKAVPPPTKRKSNVLISDESEDEKPQIKSSATSKASSSKPTPKSKPTKATTPAKATPAKRARIISSSDEDQDGDDPFEPSSDDDKKKPVVAKKSPISKPRASTSSVKAKPTPKRPRVVDDDDEEAQSTSEEEKPKKKAKTSTPAASKKSADPSSSKVKATPTPKPKPSASAKKVKQEDPPVKVEDDAEKPKKKWIPPAAKGPPRAAGSKAVPEDGDPNALAGLAIVFTGELSAFSREEVVEMAKRFGGRVTGAPSGKTDYVVVGAEAGPKKLLQIQKLGIKTLDEDGFLNLIATRRGVLDKKQLEKQAKEEKKLLEDAAELAKRDKAAKAKGVETSSQLWTTKYAPSNMKEIVGNKSNAEKIQQWLHDWPVSLKKGFKGPGPNGMNTFRAILISGPPGIGKTTSAHVAARLEGYTPVELNASDARSKKLVESSTNISNTSLDGWMSGKHDGDSTTVAGFKITDNTVLIMDEVDGMSAGDRGGVGALNALIKKTRIPIICIANDRRSQKLKPLTATCYNMTFSKPTVAQVRARMMTIATREKVKLAPNVMDSLIEGANSDIRQVLNMLSTWKLSHNDMDFDQGKRLAQANQKHLIMTPYTIMDKLFGPYTFSATSRETLADKMDYYFQDHSFVPLFVQENYWKPTPARTRGCAEGPDLEMKRMVLLDKAASAISDGDLVDNMIHQGNQWSLMPLHAVHSTVKPAYFMYGTGLGYGGRDNSTSFPSWLGQNSKQSKLQRQLGEIQIRMRLKVSGDRSEIRQSYIPALFPQVVLPLMSKDSEAEEVDEVIERMDEYFVSRDDWDTLVELGVGDLTQDVVLKKIPTATKTAFTKKYNASEHPIPFHKATEFNTKTKKIAKGEMPDQEDVLDNEDDAGDEEPEESPESDYDVSKDKLIKQAKAKAKAKPRASASGAKASSSKAKK